MVLIVVPCGQSFGKGGTEKDFDICSKITRSNFNNKHQLDKLHSHLHFIKTQSLDMFRPSLAHPREALHEHSFIGCSILL
jgi:hypothetical protein